MFILLLSILIALVIVVFAVQNAAVVPVQFLFWSTELPLVLVIFCSVFAGALLMFCLALWRELKHQISKRPKLQNSKKKAQNNDPIDLSDLKAPPNAKDPQDKVATPNDDTPAKQ
jgi:uncharacterized integral membrane protein